MKITGTRSYIKIEMEGKVLKIAGELTLGGFVADRETIKNWDPPHDGESIDDLLKQKIIDMIVEKSKNSHVVVTFE